MKSKRLQTQKAPTSIRLSPDELVKVKALAEKESRSMASMLRVLLSEALTQRQESQLVASGR
jgi:hypothetical protein